MKYGESTFDVLYLLFAIICGIIIVIKSKKREHLLMGIASIVLGCGDAFHLVPRVLNYFIDADMNLYLGIGKLVTSVTMTIFYVILYYVWIGFYKKGKNKKVELLVWIIAALRIGACAFAQNGWFENENNLTWSIIRNVPFVILGVIIMCLYYLNRNENKTFRFVWLYILLSFAFYIPVAIGAMFVPMLGMLMLPKTICYILLIVAFIIQVFKDERKESIDGGNIDE